MTSNGYRKMSSSDELDMEPLQTSCEQEEASRIVCMGVDATATSEYALKCKIYKKHLDYTYD